MEGKPFKGCVHIYCGDGKGKTSAAIGLAVRAAGRKKTVLMARFLKHDDSGEVKGLSQIQGIIVMPCEKNFGFFYQMTQDQKKEAKEYYGSLFRGAWTRAVEEGFDVLILDEIVAACRYGLVSEQEVIQELGRRPRKLEVALTGRDPSRKLVELADYVSRIRKEKHPFDRGEGAREGIEF